MIDIGPYSARISTLEAEFKSVEAQHGREHPAAQALQEQIRKTMSAARFAAEEAKRNRILLGDECYVCYLDVEGFRSRVAQDAAELYEAYVRLRQYMLASFFGVTVGTSGGELTLYHLDRLIWPYAFSDSWFFASIDSSEEALRQVSTAGAGLFARFMELGLVARGGISRGRTWWNPREQIVLGPAVTDAYLRADEYDGFGVVIDPVVAAGAAPGSVTSPFTIQMRCGGSDAERQFARLYAHIGNKRWSTAGYRAMFRTPACRRARRSTRQ